jgi:hypothetical protein
MSSTRRRGRDVLLIALSILVPLGVVAGFRFFVRSSTLNLDTGIAAAVYAALGVLYGVMLAQLVIAAWSDYEEVRAATFREAAGLMDLIRLAQGFRDEADRRAIWNAVADYADTVIAVEWSAMERGIEPGPAGEEMLDRLVRHYAKAAQDPAHGSSFLDASLSELDEVGDARGVRQRAVRWNLHRLLWAALHIEGALIVGFVAFFGVKVVVIHEAVLMVLVLAVVVLLALVWCLDHPFQRPASITPDDFTEVKGLAQRALRSDGTDLVREDCHA